jgi:DNA-binding transcriptional LysR family regulator
MIHFCYHSFDLRQLVSFAEIARTGSFRQAAKTLHIAQPALREANPVLYDELISCCHKASFTPNVIAEMTQRPRVVSQVACGIGIATLVQTMRHLCIGGTSFHRLIRPTPMLDCYLVYRKNPSSPILKSFISICLEVGRDSRLGGAWLYPELNDCYSRSRRQWMQRG